MQNLMVEAIQAMDATRSSMAFMEAVRILKSPKSNAADVAKAIQFDPKLADAILMEVNSPFFALPNKIEILDQAIALLGFDRIETLLNKTISHEMYAQVESSYTEMVSFKKHGAAVGCIAEQLANLLQFDDPKDFFQAGMMHDLGKFLYLTKFTNEFKKLGKEMRETGVPMYQLEKKYLGTDHAELGEMMADAWGLPDSIRVAARYHHLCTDKERERLTTRETAIVELITCANQLAKGGRFGGGAVLPKDMVLPTLLSEEDIAKALSLAETQYDEVIRDMGFA
jgi:HD-like signal output (HDOD) protein